MSASKLDTLELGLLRCSVVKREKRAARGRKREPSGVARAACRPKCIRPPVSRRGCIWSNRVHDLPETDGLCSAGRGLAVPSLSPRARLGALHSKPSTTASFFLCRSPTSFSTSSVTSQRRRQPQETPPKHPSALLPCSAFPASHDLDSDEARSTASFACCLAFFHRSSFLAHEGAAGQRFARIS